MPREREDYQHDDQEGAHRTRGGVGKPSRIVENNDKSGAAQKRKDPFRDDRQKRRVDKIGEAPRVERPMAHTFLPH